jgi:anaerobic magnesium-protoporphyrin IX monomethyl ester cyclase
MNQALKVALLYPPVTDPTAAYHSLTYLDSYARSRGFPGADLFDANIEAFHYTYSPAGAAWLDRCRAAAPDLPAGAPIPDHVLRARRLRDATASPDTVREAVRVLRDPVLFYEYPRYLQAVDDVIAWMNHVGAAGFPGQFSSGFQGVPTPGVAAGSVPELTDTAVLARYGRPFQAYYEDALLPRLRAGGYDVIGLSVGYSWQLPFALHLLRLIRSAVPGAFLIAGGTEVSDAWKYARDKAMFFQIFADCDATVVGEGETAYTAILEAVAAGTLPAGHPNIRLHPRYGPARLLPARYEPLASLPTPDFSNLPWHLYLSPEPFVYYAPARGCYWNKCTFCDYGLNGDSPTSPWRQDTAELMIRDVTEIAKQARFIYFSVDVLAPATILRFAEEAAARKLDIRWGAEIRLEKYWSDERCELLRRSGCVAVSVGFESGNQRILDLIDKGTRPDRIKQTITAMTRAGIAVQMMGFTGFPTETAEEAMDSIRFLLDNREQWTFGGLGDFLLTSGAIIARQPGRFGISNVRPMPGSGIARALDYDEPVSQQARGQVAAAKAALGGTRHPRPWLGSVDAPHSFFYHDRHGPKIVNELRNALLGDRGQAHSFVINGCFREMPDPATMKAYAAMYGGQPAAGEGADGCFRRADGTVFLLTRGMRSFLALFAQPRSLAEVSAETLLSGVVARKLWEAALHKGLIRQVLPGAA